MRAHPPMRVPTTRTRLTQLIRRGSMSLGTSTPAAAAPAPEGRPGCLLPPEGLGGHRVEGGSLEEGEGSHQGVGGQRSQSPRQPLAPGPATSATAARTAAVSRSSWSSVATVDGGPEVDEPGPSVLVDHDGLGGQRAVGDACGLQGVQLPEDVVEGGVGDRRRRRTVADRHRVAGRAGSVVGRSGAVGVIAVARSRSSAGGPGERRGEAASRRPSGGRVTNSASWAGPAGPAASTAGTRAPARAAIRVRYASCSTCWRRVRVRVGPESR